MTLPLVFNELSTERPLPDATGAKVVMEAFVRALVRLGQLGLRQPLLACWDLSSAEIAPEYRIAQWLNDTAVERELRQVWRSRVSGGRVLRLDDLEGDEESLECFSRDSPGL